MARGLSKLQKQILIIIHEKGNLDSSIPNLILTVGTDKQNIIIDGVEHTLKKKHGYTSKKTGKQWYEKVLLNDNGLKCQELAQQYNLEYDYLFQVDTNNRSHFEKVYHSRHLNLKVVKKLTYYDLYKHTNSRGSIWYSKEKTKKKNSARITLHKSMKGLIKRGLVFSYCSCLWLTDKGLTITKKLAENEIEILDTIRTNIEKEKSDKISIEI